MKLQEPAAQPSGLGSVVTTAQPRQVSPIWEIINFFRKTMIIASWEVRKLRHDPTDILTRSVQPVLWLLIFGEVFSRIRAIPTGQTSYLDFLAPGILSQSVLFIAIFYGITIIWERDLGVINKFLVSPTPRLALVLGKALSAGARAIPQAIVIYVIAAILRVNLNWNPLDLLGVLLIIVLGAACFSTFSMIVACWLKTRDRVMGIGQVMTMPLFFASNAIYPISIMPGWLQFIAHINPLTYVVDGVRAMMLAGGTSESGIGTDILVLVVITMALALFCARLYPRIVQ